MMKYLKMFLAIYILFFGFFQSSFANGFNKDSEISEGIKHLVNDVTTMNKTREEVNGVIKSLLIEQRASFHTSDVEIRAAQERNHRHHVPAKQNSKREALSTFNLAKLKKDLKKELDFRETCDEKKKYLYDKYVDAEEEIERLKSVVSKTEEQKKAESNIIWFARIRAAIESFEDKYGFDVYIDWEKVNAEKGSIKKSREIRIQKWLHIFYYEKNERMVMNLITKIESSEIKTTTNYAVLMGDAFGDLSTSLHTALMTPGGGSYEAVGATREPALNIVVKLLWDLYDIKDEVVRKKSKDEVVEKKSKDEVVEKKSKDEVVEKKSKDEVVEKK